MSKQAAEQRFRPLDFIRDVMADGSLDTREKAVLVAAAVGADNATFKVRRSLSRLAKDAGCDRGSMSEMVERAHCIVVPVVPSVIDLHATGNFLRELAAFGRVRSGSVPLAVVANKVRRSMPAYRPLETLLQSVNLRLLARLLDSDVFLRSAESGLGIFELDENLSVSERKQFLPIVEWVEDRHLPQPAPARDGVVYSLARTRSA